MINLGLILLQQAAPNSALSFLPLVLIVGIFYFLVFMPMQKQKKQTAQMLEGLQSGNEVVTSGGMVGTVVSVNGDTVILRIKPDNLKLQFAKSAVTGLVQTDKDRKSTRLNSSH